MSKPTIERINLLDTEYAEILSNSTNSEVELRLIQMGVHPLKARNKTNFLTLVQKKPQTPQEWQNLMNAWETAYGYRPEEADLEMISKMVWDKSESAF